MATRDRLTGEPLRRETPKLVIRDYDVSRPHRIREAPPMRLHRGETEDGPDDPAEVPNAPEGLEWTRDAGRYLEHGVPRFLAEERRYIEWWDIAWIQRRMRDRLSDAVVDMALAIERDGVTITAYAQQSGRAQSWMFRKLRLVRILSSQYWRPRPCKSNQQVSLSV